MNALVVLGLILVIAGALLIDTSEVVSAALIIIGLIVTLLGAQE